MVVKIDEKQFQETCDGIVTKKQVKNAGGSKLHPNRTYFDQAPNATKIVTWLGTIFKVKKHQINKALITIGIKSLGFAGLKKALAEHFKEPIPK